MSNQPLPQSEIILYQTEDGRTHIQCRFEDETVWLNQSQMAELFQTTQQNVSLHVRNIYEEGELEHGATHKEFLSVRQEGVRSVQRKVEFYNLDVIISVGYRVKSLQGKQFRIWATQRLREYIVKGFTMDDERLKNPPGKGHIDYFDELLARIRDIRSSERRVYLRVYGVEAKVLVQAVKRNAERFPDDFVFQLTKQEDTNLKSQFVTSSWGGARRALPYAFTEQGVAMLSSVLRSTRAVQVNIEIMRAFVRLRQLLTSNTELARKLTSLENKYDAQFKVVFDAIRELMKPPEPGKKRPIGFAPWRG